MNILICSKTSIPAVNRTLPVWDHARSLGHRVTVTSPESLPYKPNAIISMGVTVMEETFRAVTLWPDVPLFCYNWDCYEWVWTNPRPGEYNYCRYGDLLRLAKVVWVPSDCTATRTRQWWPWVKRIDVIRSACPWWNYDKIRDEGYILCTLREIPDPAWKMFEQACRELSLPYHMTRHECSYEDYQNAVANCRFLVSHLYEASTGGLTLLEGYYHRKPCLVSDSPWNGAVDYLGDRANYFDHKDYNNFKLKLAYMHSNILEFVPPPDARAYVMENFSDQSMVDGMLRSISDATA